MPNEAHPRRHGALGRTLNAQNVRSSSAYKTSPLAGFQWANDPEAALGTLSPANQDRELVRISEKIAEALSPAPQATTVTPRDKP
jgi:hypothetical protein